MERVKELLRIFRNALAFCYSWLVICSLAVTFLLGKDALSVAYLVKLFVLCVWAAFSFVLCFRTEKMQQRGFIFSLSCFYIMFIPVEIALFYLMHLFKGVGSIAAWILFFALIAAMYIVSLLIDHIVMKKKALSYTRKLTEYIGNQSGD